MPELPEVETITRILKPLLIGKTINKIDVYRNATIIGDAKLFVKSLTRQTYKDITRIGKFLIFHFSNDYVLITHLRMEGKFYDFLESEPDSDYAKVVFHLDNGHKMCFDDSRCFGIMILSTESEYKNVKDLAHLGPEPFYIDDCQYLIDRTKRSNHPIKSTLLDQTLMAGIGNIYADEICFACGLNPLTPAKLLTKKDWENVVESAKKILTQAIQEGGSTIKSYHPSKDIDGKFQGNLKAYGKIDEPCPRCGHIMKFIKVNGRGSNFCPICQPKKGSPIRVGIFGPIASGKSTVTELFAKEGFDTISSDKIISELYMQEEVATNIGKMFSLPFIDRVNKSTLREHLSRNPKDIKKLERYIHPLVEKEITNFFAHSKSKIKVAEVPLLYQAHLEENFDYIIGVDIDPKIQLKRLTERNGDASKPLLIINCQKSFSEYMKKADIVVRNDTGITSLTLEVRKIIDTLIGRLD